MSKISRLITPLALLFALSAGPALADSNAAESAAKNKANPDYTRAQQKVDDGRYADAITLLERIVATDKENADALNLLGYSNRQLGNNDVALGYYEAALKLEPRHRGANEYMGELYLTLGDLAKAEERLDVLDRACFFGCAEYTKLKEAIAAHKAKLGS